MPKNFADALGEQLQETSRGLLPFMQLMRQQRVEASEQQFSRDLAVSKYQQDVDELDLRKAEFSERRHENMLEMYRYLHPRNTQSEPTTFWGLAARHLQAGGKIGDPVMLQLLELKRQEAEAGRGPDKLPASQTGASIGRNAMAEIDQATRTYNIGKATWEKGGINGSYPVPAPDTTAILSREMEYARGFGEQHGFSQMIGSNWRLRPYMMQLESRMNPGALTASPAQRVIGAVQQVRGGGAVQPTGTPDLSSMSDEKLEQLIQTLGGQ